MNSFQLNPMVDIRLAIGLAIIMFSVFGYFEWIKPVRFRVWRLIALFSIILAVLIYAINPTYTTSSSVKPIMVLTKSYSLQQADSLQSLIPLDVYDLSGKDNSSSARALAKLKPQVKFVLGNGLPASLLNTQSGFEFSYLPGKTPTGLIELILPKFKAGVSNKLIGKFNCQNKTIITLSGPGQHDSTTLEPGMKMFEFNIKPKLAGRFTYELKAKSGNEEILTELIPIEIPEREKLNILFLQTYPTFETRYLKNYLEEDGHSILLRYETSKNIFRYESSNAPPINSIPNITLEKLSSFDLVILSDEAANQLSASSHETIFKSIKEGLGVLILLSEGNPSKFLNQISIKLNKVNYDSVSIPIEEPVEKIKLQSARNRILDNPEFTSFFQDKSGSVSGFQNYGKGRIGFQLIQNTYQLKLEGKMNFYNEVWYSLLENVARQEQKPYQIKIRSSLPYYVDQPINIEVISNENTPKLFYQAELIPLLEDVSVPKLYQTTIWPKQMGWNRITLSDSSQLNFYVTPSDGLQSLAIANQIKLNQAFDSEMNPRISQTRTINKKISPLILFLIFLISYGFLWLAPKI